MLGRSIYPLGLLVLRRVLTHLVAVNLIRRFDIKFSILSCGQVLSFLLKDKFSGPF